MKLPDNLTERQKEDEWFYLMGKYPNIAFNSKQASTYFTPEKGYHTLLVCEPRIEIMEMWNPSFVAKYQNVITWSSKFYHQIKNRTNAILLPCPPFCNQSFNLDTFKSYDEKEKGLLIINKVNSTGQEGDIYYLRNTVLQELDIEPRLSKNVWCRDFWGGPYYRGKVNAPYHSHIENLKKINEHLFVLCFESTYHPMWSYDFLTERLINSFKSKTVAIYYGCYNIEDKVPTDLFIDYRLFNGDIKALSRYLLNMSKSQYEDMIEKAFEWQKTSRLGSIEDLESILSNLN